MLRGILLFTALAAGFRASHGYVAAPLIGYGQGLTIQVTPGSSTNEQCYVYGIPTASGYADRGAGPLFLYTPKNTGIHVLQFAYNTDAYYLDPFLAPGQSILTIDASNRLNPLISYDATRSNQGQQAAVIAYLRDKRENPICYVQIQLTIDVVLGCAPVYGGVIIPGGGGVSGLPGGAGTFIIPTGTIYAPTYVTNVVVQQFTQINNINIQNVVVNVNQITNVNVINNIVVNVPPTPAPVNCTITPSNPSCVRPPTPLVTPSAGPSPARSETVAAAARGPAPPNTTNPAIAGSNTTTTTTTSTTIAAPGRAPAIGRRL